MLRPGFRSGALRAAAVAALACGGVGCRQDGVTTAPTPAQPAEDARSFRSPSQLTDADVRAILGASDPAFAAKLRKSDGAPRGPREPLSHMGQVIVSSITEEQPPPYEEEEEPITPAPTVPVPSWSGEIKGHTIARIEYNQGYYAYVVGHTSIESGVPIWTTLSTHGSYMKDDPGDDNMGDATLFSGSCKEWGGKDCYWGDFFYDFDCFSTMSGYVTAASTHSALFLSGPHYTDVSRSARLCNRGVIKGITALIAQGGESTCYEEARYRIIPDDYEPPPNCDEGGGGDGDGSGNTGGGGYPGDGADMCRDLKLEAGCYDVYVDGEFVNTLCCP